MATITGSEVLAKALRTQGVDTMFYLMGGPMLETEAAAIALGIRAIDHRHEQAAAFAAHAYTRVLRRPGVCMGAPGPGAPHPPTGVATAFTDCAPLVPIGGASPRVSFGMEAFQEIDQLAVFKPVTKGGARGSAPPRAPPGGPPPGCPSAWRPSRRSISSPSSSRSPSGRPGAMTPSASPT